MDRGDDEARYRGGHSQHRGSGAHRAAVWVSRFRTVDRAWWTIGGRGSGIDRSNRSSPDVDGAATERRRAFKLLGDGVFCEEFEMSPSDNRDVHERGTNRS